MARKKKTDNEIPKEETEDVSDVEQRAIDLVCGAKKDSETFYCEKFKQFTYFDRLYTKGAAKSNVPYGRANLELPLGFQQVEPFVDTMTETMLGEAPYIAYEGRNLDDEPAAEEITNYAQYQLDCGGFLPAKIQYYRNLGKYGTAVMKVAWETDILDVDEEVDQPIIGIDPLTGQAIDTGEFETITQTNEYKKHDGPVFYNLSLFDFFIPRSATNTDIQKMEFVIHRTYRSLEELAQNPNYERNKKKIQELLDEKKEEEKKDENSSFSSTASRNKKNKTESKKFEGKIEVLEYWGEFRHNKSDKFAKPSLIVIALIDDEKICLRLDLNPFKFKFKPFLMSNDYSIEGEAYGYGELHHIKGLIEEATALRNARLDVANISLNRVWLVERHAGVNLRELYTAPNKVILTNDLNGIRPMDMGQVTSSSVNELARIDWDIQNTTEIVNPRQDVASVGGAFSGTATGVNFMAGKGNRRLLTKARLQEQTFFKPLAHMLNWYNRDLITDDVYYRIAGEDTENPYKHLPSDAFLTEVDFKSTSNPQKLSIDERRGNMGYFLQTVGQIIKVKPNVNIKVEELIKDTAKLAGMPHPEKYVGPSQTTIIQTPDGQFVDEAGQPVQVIPVDETGKPVEQPPEGSQGTV